jgi:hypothetical protein
MYAVLLSCTDAATIAVKLTMPDEFLAARANRELPFCEILINSVEGTIRLK